MPRRSKFGFLIPKLSILSEMTNILADNLLGWGNSRIFVSQIV